MSQNADSVRLIQVGWMNPRTGVMCDCPVYERSPHANSVPVYREERIQNDGSGADS